MKRTLAAVLASTLWLPALASFAGTVSEAKLGTDIVDRQISGETTTFSLNDTAYLWMRVVDSGGEAVTVTWSNGDESWDVSLNIGSDSWRTWSSKILHLPGEWTVTISDASGNNLHQSNLTVQ